MNCNKIFTIKLLFLSLLFQTSLSISQEVGAYTTEVVKLNYLSPTEVIESLMLNSSPEGYKISLNNASVCIRFNVATNEALLSGNEAGIAEVKKMISILDVAPRQIVIEVKIIEIDNQKMSEIGVDWQNVLDQTNVTIGSDFSKRSYDNTGNQDSESKSTRWSVNFGSQLGNLMQVIQESGVGKIINVPKIVTTNNKAGRILDGERIKYVSRYSSYSNIYETEEMTAGLSLEVTPSLGQSGYLKMDVSAKLTTLGSVISGSPSEAGQIIENTVIVKDKQSFLLGSFKQTETRKIRKRFPLLGHILPFLFSKHVDIEVTKDVLIILTPTVIDLNPIEIPQN